MSADVGARRGTRAEARNAPCRTLAEYVRALLDGLAVGDPTGYTRLRTIVQNRRALIEVDDEEVEVLFDGPAFRVDETRTGRPLDGAGRTQRRTVVDLLQGRIEVSEAITSGQLDVRGRVDDIARIFQALQVLVDSSTRVPKLQQLARDYLEDPCAEPLAPGAGAYVEAGRGPFSMKPLSTAESEMLNRLGLLP